MKQLLINTPRNRVPEPETRYPIPENDEDPSSARIDRPNRTKQSRLDELHEARASMVAAVRVARERALAMMEQAEKPAEVVRLCREVERLVRCEAWLLGLEPKKLDAGEKRDPDAEELDRFELDRFLDSLEADLGISCDEELGSEPGTPIPETRSPTPENGEDPSPARTELAHPAAMATASAP